ncbi:hypothetical protein K9M79_06935 [Candidatus Woesearchaeota archaeon]|nr:hypothetical protein [Candidatus Woesearchaeota archaeon]
MNGKTLCGIMMALIISMSFVSAAIGDRKDQINNTITNIEPLKDALMNSINRKVASIEKFVSKIGDSDIPAADKEELEGIFNQIKSDLEAFLPKIQAAESIDDLKGLMAEANQYIKDNKQQIVGAIEKYMTALDLSAAQVIEDILQELATLLTDLLKSCPQNAQEIIQLQKDVGTLLVEIGDLMKKINAGMDKDAMKTEIDKVAVEAKRLIDQYKNLEAECSG